jgi:hypothetical protein
MGGQPGKPSPPGNPMDRVRAAAAPANPGAAAADTAAASATAAATDGRLAVLTAALFPQLFVSFSQPVFQSLPIFTVSHAFQVLTEFAFSVFKPFAPLPALTLFTPVLRAKTGYRNLNGGPLIRLGLERRLRGYHSEY